MSSPKVSIICGFYNRANLVRRTLEGIRRQEFRDFEVIIFDDKSTDNTAVVIKSILSEFNDQRFKLILHTENIGFTYGLINAIQIARGEYIAIHDSGDVSLPRRLRLQVEVLEKNSNVSVVGSYYINFIEHKEWARPRRPNSDNATLESVFKNSQFTHGEVLIRRSVYDEVGGYRREFKFSQDSDLWLRMIKVSEFRTVKEFLYVRYVQLSGISYKPNTFAAQCGYYVLARILAAATPDSERQLLQKLEHNEIFDVLPLMTPAVQHLIVRGALRGLMFGDIDQAMKVVQKYVCGRLQRSTLKIICLMAGTTAGKVITKLLGKVFGVRKISETELLDIL